ncbi:hypothetical protein ACFQXB_00360 [Plastorhodobacter daqingensis]|uniref:HEAT repeat domain-containing protein n=1 Tax=Plastorhodobacter daqingensis TaxID=1387281 RepID=A0ABW2UEQ1_9RHOB
MKRILTFTSALALLAAPAVAEEVRVLSGEHGRFTRLAMVLESPSGWEFGRVEGGYELRFARGGISFDTTSVFSRIARRRIADVAVNPTTNGLRIALDCTCYANVFEDRPGLIVIDIREGRAPAASRFEMALSDVPPAVPAIIAPNAPEAIATDFSLYWRGRLVSEGPPVRAEAPSPEPDPDDTGRFAQAQAHLVEQLARAASQGLLEASVADLPGTPGAEPSPSAPPPPEPAPALAGHLSLRAQSALDRELAGPAARLADISPSICAPDSVFDLSDQGDGRPAADQIARARAAVVGEFDTPSVAAIEAMARTYLHFGFGAEARRSLTAFNVVVPNGEILATMGYILDSQQPRSQSSLAGMTGCDGAAALWALLAAASPPERDTVNTEAVVQGFSALPLHLRRHLGDRLAERLLALGETEAAELVRKAIERAIPDDESGLSLLNARMNIARGKDSAAEKELRRAAQAGGAEGAEAHAWLVETRLRQGQPVDPDLVATAAALAFEHRGTELGRRLARAEVLALAASGAIPDAFAAFVRHGQDPDAADPLLEYLTGLAPDAMFVELLYAHRDLLETPRPAALRRAVARRLIDLGFPELGQLPLLVALPPEAADRVLLAEAALTRRDPQQALRHLAGLEGAPASRVRGLALEALGQHAAAALAFAEAEDGALQAEALWRAGDIAGAAELDPVRRDTLAAIAPTVLPQQSDADTSETLPGDTAAAAELEVTLAASRSLLEDSRANRESLEALLAAFELPRRP